MGPILMLLAEYRLGLSLKTSNYLEYLRDVKSVGLYEFVNELKRLCIEQGPGAGSMALIKEFEEFFKQIDALIECEEPSFDDKVKCHIQLVAIEAMIERKDNITGESNVVH